MAVQCMKFGIGFGSTSPSFALEPPTRAARRCTPRPVSSWLSAKWDARANLATHTSHPYGLSFRRLASHNPLYPYFRTSFSRDIPDCSRGHSRLAAPRAAQEVRTEQKVKVTLGPYKDGAMSATVPAPKVSEEEVEKALKERQSRTHDFERINFTGTGAKLGHTVLINFEGMHAEGPQAGQPLRGTKAVGYELELKERTDEPWRTFVEEITKQGMGQEESKVFEVRFPQGYKAPPLAGVRARFNVTVKAIGVKKELPKEIRTLEEQRDEVRGQLQAAAERRTNDALNAAIRAALLESSQADVEKVAASVTWAKFGEKSLQDFKWNVLQEEVARLEGIEFEDVMPFLRSQMQVTYA